MNEKIANDLKEAMKSGNKFKLSVLRMLKSALQLEKINQKHDLDDTEVIAVIKRQVKVRKDSIVEYTKYNKTDLIESLKEEIAILSEYLPQEATEEEINKAINEAFKKINPSSIKQMGIIMKELGNTLANADMSIVSKKVKERLQ